MLGEHISLIWTRKLKQQERKCNSGASAVIDTFSLPRIFSRTLRSLPRPKASEIAILIAASGSEFVSVNIQLPPDIREDG